ncbi:hypothetical protein PUN28_016942 [Cardiocondyla obscurior]|uniref:Uncharacterized protein n=1 Tax=Cardiocondyla obscurior TaxID=286306 RepID=A0AAW2EPZ6_9HYME
MGKSVAAWIEKGSRIKDIDPQISELLVAAFRLEFYRQFYKDKKIWPRLVTGPAAPRKIKNSYMNNTWGETAANSWCPKDFYDVRIEKNLDFD